MTPDALSQSTGPRLVQENFSKQQGDGSFEQAYKQLLVEINDIYEHAKEFHAKVREGLGGMREGLVNRPAPRVSGRPAGRAGGPGAVATSQAPRPQQLAGRSGGRPGPLVLPRRA